MGDLHYPQFKPWIYFDTQLYDRLSLEDSMLNEVGGKNDTVSQLFFVETASSLIIKLELLWRKPSKSRTTGRDFNIPAN